MLRKLLGMCLLLIITMAIAADGFMPVLADAADGYDILGAGTCKCGTRPYCPDRVEESYSCDDDKYLKCQDLSDESSSCSNSTSDDPCGSIEGCRDYEGGTYNLCPNEN